MFPIPHTGCCSVSTRMPLWVSYIGARKFFCLGTTGSYGILHPICLGHVPEDGYVLRYNDGTSPPASVGLWCMR
jgi:hypothetical protein